MLTPRLILAYLFIYAPEEPTGMLQSTVQCCLVLLATRNLKKLAEDKQTEFPRAAQALSQEF